MGEKRFRYRVIKGSRQAHIIDCHTCKSATIDVYDDNIKYFVDKLNEQQELIEELQVSDEMGWKRAEKFEKKCPKELHNKKMYIKRLEYKVQKFKEENEQLKKARDESDKFIVKKGLEIEFLNWCVENE